jgi:heme A synthase
MDGNMTERSREVRRVLGRIALVTAAILSLWMARNTGRAPRLLLFLPWFLGALGFLQAREKT